MIKALFFLFLSFTTLFSLEFTVASYNVENLFDLKHDGTEYQEYIPNTKSNWNQKIFEQKVNNVKKVITQLNADIIGLQEVESKEALDTLTKKLPQYPYSAFSKKKNASIGLALLSKFPIINHQQINVPQSRVKRPIQKVTLSINNNKFIIFNNHWPSKRQAENERIRYAMKLQKNVKKLSSRQDYILLGDFNSNYNEFETIKLESRLNNTQGLTGINHVLNSYENEQFITKSSLKNISKKVHYNTWLELSYNNRFSNIFRGTKTTPDNILFTSALFDKHAISYVENSFHVFKPPYLFKNKKINRWKMKNNYKVHVGKGYSDHLPIMASFSTQLQKKTTHQTRKGIEELYKNFNLDSPIIFKDAVVIYKNKDSAIIKQKNNRAIYLYRCAKNLKLGLKYDIRPLRIKEHYGLKEITQIEVLRKKNKVKNIQTFYLDAKSKNLHDLKLQNEIVSNLNGIYKKGYFYTNHTKIKLYAKERTLLPKDGQNVTIISGHLGFFKNKAQIIIYKTSDIKVNH